MVTVIKYFNSRTDRYIILDRNFFTYPTKLTDGINTIEVQLNRTIVLLESSVFCYNIRNMGPLPWEWAVGTKLEKTGDSHHLHNNKIHIPDRTRFYYLGDYDPYKQDEEISKTRVSMYLEADLVPSQFFGLDDYLRRNQ